MQPFSSRTMTPDDWGELRHFAPAEFNRPEMMGWEFIRWLDAVRQVAGVAMRITSSYRTPERNAAVGGAEDSAHTDVPCEAVDVAVVRTATDPNGHYARYQIVSVAMQLGCVRLGVYPGGGLHLDRSEARRPAPRMWNAVDNPAARP